MFKLNMAIVTAFLILFTPMVGQAASNIAVLNIQQIMRDSLAAQSIRSKLESKQKSFRNEMAKKEEQLQAKERSLSQQKSVIAPSEFEKKVKDFHAEATKAQREVQTKKAKLDKAFAEALDKVQVTVRQIVEEMAKDKKFHAVFPTSQLLYADPTLDITQPVLQQLNQRLPNVAINF